MKRYMSLSISAFVAIFVATSPNIGRAEFPLFVTDQNTNSVNAVDNSGNVSVFASTALSSPSSLEFRGTELFVGNFAGSTVRRFSSTGADLGVFASAGLSNVNGLAFDESGDLYVSSSGNGTVRRFSPTGTDLGVFVSGLDFPAAIAFNSSGDLFVAEYNTSRIHKFSAAGSSLGSFSSGGSLPFRMAFDPLGDLYVSHLGSDTIRRFSPAGSDLGNFVTGRHITGITFDDSGTLYALDQTTAGTIRRYSLAGADLGVFASGFNSVTDLRFVVVPEPSSLLLVTMSILWLAACMPNRFR